MCSRVRFITSAIGPEKTSSPKRMTTRWSHTASISESWCEETMTVRPLRPRSRSSSRISTIPAGSSPFVGSSRMSSSGSERSAAAIPRRCFMPEREALHRLPVPAGQADLREHGVHALEREVPEASQRHEVRPRRQAGMNAGLSIEDPDPRRVAPAAS